MGFRIYKEDAFRALGSGKRRVYGLKTRLIERCRSGKRIPPELQLHRVKVRALGHELLRHAVANVMNPCPVHSVSTPGCAAAASGPSLSNASAMPASRHQERLPPAFRLSVI